MKKLFNIYRLNQMLFGICLFLVFSCIDRLDFIGDTVEGQVIIYGLLAAGESTHTVNVGESRNLGFSQRGISNASVSLIFQNGSKMPYTSIGNGNYELRNFNPNEGESYALEVIVSEKVFRSGFQEVPTAIGTDSLWYEVANEPFRTSASEHVFKVYSKSEVPQSDTPVYLRWIAEETAYWELVWIYAPGIPPPMPPPCFITDNMESTKINLFDGSASNSRIIEQHLATRIMDNTFIWPVFISVKQLSINREAYEYWNKIDIVVNNQGSLFDIPPAPITGNIQNVNDPSDKVLGFFEVAKSRTTRFYVTSEISPVYFPPPCAFVLGRPFLEYPSECWTCADRAAGRRFVIVRPEWWIYD